MTRVSKKVRPGFTLMELMVAVALLVGVILAVGMVFQGTSKAVSLSQATTEAFSGVRALQSKIEKDLSGLDPNGFLIIRSRADATNTRRFDQIAFLSNGTFRNPTGGNVGGNATFVDRSVANAARVWYGHLVIAADGVSTLDANGTPVSYASQASAVALNALPTGQRDQDFVLGRQATLLFPDDGYTGVNNTITSVANLPILAFQRDLANDIRRTATIAAGNMPANEQGNNLSITSSRCAAAGYPPTVIMNSIMVSAVNSATGIRSNATYEVDNYCYRFRALPNIWSSVETATAVNGYFRMHPILLSGVPSFAVEWSDGSTNTATGALNWYGMVDGAVVPKHGNNVSYTLIEPNPASAGGGDGYVAQFSFDSKAQWPKALRFTYRVTDPQDRLAGGRTFVQVVALPR